MSHDVRQGAFDASMQPRGAPAGSPAGSTDRRICDTRTSAELADEDWRAEARAMLSAAELARGDREPETLLERWLVGVLDQKPGWMVEHIAERWSRRALDVQGCGQARWLRTYDGRAERWQPSRCRDRLCSRCWGMSAARRERDVAAMITRARELGARLVFVTLTMAVPGWGGGRRTPPDPRDAIDRALEAWRTVRQRGRRDGAIIGGWRRLEVTWRRPRKRVPGRPERVRAHAHIHAVTLVPEASSSQEVRDVIVGRWLEAVAELGAKADDKAQDVDRVDNDAQTRRYLLKYLQKVDEYNSNPAIAGLAAHTLRARQLVAPFGAAHALSSHAMARPLREVRDELRAERERYGAATLGECIGLDMAELRHAERDRRDAVRPIEGWPPDLELEREALERLEPVRGVRADWADVITMGLDGAPGWMRRQVERSDLAAARLRLSPAMLARLAEDGAPQAIAWISELELDTGPPRSDSG